MAFAQPMANTFTLNRASGSGATADSPFNSALNTPDDESVLHPFDQLGKQLLAGLDSESSLDEKNALNLNETSDIIDMKKEDDSSYVAQTSRNIASLTESLSHSSNCLVNLARDEAQPSSMDFQHIDSASSLLTTTDIHTEGMNDGIISSASESSVASPGIDFQSFNNHSRASSIYNLPNVSISISELQNLATMSNQEDNLPVPAPAPQDEHALETRLTTEISESMFDVEDEFSFPITLQDLTVQRVLVLVAKAICFVPWCVLVGATIVLSPSNLEHVAFGPGYVASPCGIHRFAHWTEYAASHVMIFVAFFTTAIWWAQDIRVTFGLIAMVFSQFVIAWQDFAVDESIPLGEDDRQAIFWAMRIYSLSPDSMMALRKTDGGYLISTTGTIDKAQVTDYDDTEDD